MVRMQGEGGEAGGVGHGVLLYYFVRQPLKGWRRIVVVHAGSHDDGGLFFDGRARGLFSSDGGHAQRHASLQEAPWTLGGMVVAMAIDHSGSGASTRGDIMNWFVFLRPCGGCERR